MSVRARCAAFLAALLLVQGWPPPLSAEETVRRPGPGPMVSAEAYPWRAIGRVNLAGRGFCTGTLVAPDAVLTAAHCLKRAQGGWYALDDVHFVAAYERGDYRVHRRIREALLPADAEPIPPGDWEELARDWAILRLDAPVEDGWLPIRVFDAALLGAVESGRAMLLQAAYRRDRAHGISLDRDCRVLDTFGVGGAGLLQSCHVVKGASGSPLLALEDGRFAVVGINVARVGRSEETGRPAGTATVSTGIFAPAARQPDARGAASRAGLAVP